MSDVQENTELVLRVFEVLLTCYYYHPVLWDLQYVCKRLRFQRPRSFRAKELKIFHYSCVARDDVWLQGILGGTQDMLLYDAAKPFEAVMAFHIDDENDENDERDDCKKVFYRIPVAWLRYIFARVEDSKMYMYLSQEPFCCRQVLCKSSVTIAQCRSNIIDERYVIGPSYFHIGLGKCWSEAHDVFLDVSLYANIKELYKLVKLYAEPYGNVRELIYILGTHERNVKFFNNEGDAVLFKGKKLKDLIRHLLVCRTCNVRLPHFIKMFNDSIQRRHAYTEDTMNTPHPDVVHGDVPCFRYILDGDFDDLLQRAYNTPLEGLKNKQVNICTDIIDPFMTCYM